MSDPIEEALRHLAEHHASYEYLLHRPVDYQVWSLVQQTINTADALAEALAVLRGRLEEAERVRDGAILESNDA